MEDQNAKLFDWENKLTTDNCAIKVKENTNSGIINYNTTSYKSEQLQQSREKLMEKYPNLHYRDGYGVSSDNTIDHDSKSRLVQPTHGPEKQQLFTRNFISIPDFGHGCLNAISTESILKNGQEAYKRGCKERLSDHFIMPLNDCMRDHLLGGRKDLRMGVDTREQWRCLSRSNK